MEYAKAELLGDCWADERVALMGPEMAYWRGYLMDKLMER